MPTERRLFDFDRLHCLFCPVSIQLYLCEDETHVAPKSRTLMTADRDADYGEFESGELFKFEPDYQHKRINPVKQSFGRSFCRDTKNVLVQVDGGFGLGPNQYFWLCAHCSCKDLPEEKQMTRIYETLRRKYNLWKDYLDTTEKEFYKKCSIEKRKATIADKKKAA